MCLTSVSFETLQAIKSTKLRLGTRKHGARFFQCSFCATVVVPLCQSDRLARRTTVTFSGRSPNDVVRITWKSLKMSAARERRRGVALETPGSNKPASTSREPEAVNNSDPGSGHHGRRQALASSVLLGFVLIEIPGRLLAEELKQDVPHKDQSIIGGLLSIFDENETTKLGKVLPKAYLKSARDVVQTLRDSLSEDMKDDAKFRRNADSAKGAIREYISNWRGAKNIAAEESYQALERALRVLSDFYSKKGPRAALSKDVKHQILQYLQLADDAL